MDRNILVYFIFVVFKYISNMTVSLLFVIVMEAISREFRVAMPWELLYADDLAVIAETEEELLKRLNEWKDNVQSKGMRVMISGERQTVRQKAVMAMWGLQ